MYKEKPRAGCSTSRSSAADGQTTGPNKREVVSHVRTTRSLDRSSPRARKTNNLCSPVNERSSMKNLEDYLPRKSRKKKTMKLPESPLYSPETLDALENAEKLMKEAQKKILEASYDVHSSPERDVSIRSAGIKTKDDDSLYIRDIVATRFHEANESGRIFTRSTSRRPIDRFYRPELRSTRCTRTVEKIGKIRNKDVTISRRLGINNKRVEIPLEDIREKSQNSTLPERRNVEEKLKTRICQFNEKSTTSSMEKYENSIKQDDQRTRQNFQIQDGPHVDIRNELTMMNLEKIDISPNPRSITNQRNIKTYEFHHESSYNRENEARATEPVKPSNEKSEIDEKSRDITSKIPILEILTSNHENAILDLVENKSGRSIQSERLEGHENTKITYRDVPTINEKLDAQGESFMDFLKHAGNDVNVKLPDVNFPDKNSSIPVDNEEKIHIFDRAVRQFFQNFRYKDQTDVNYQPEIDTVDGKLAMDDDVFEKSDNFMNNEYFENINYHEDNCNANELNLKPPNLGELEIALKKLDVNMNKVFRDTKNLGLLLSEYSTDPETSKLSKNPDPINADTCTIDRERFYALPTRDISSELENNEIERNHGKKSLTKSDNCKIKDSSNDENFSATSGGFFKEFSEFSECEKIAKKVSIAKKKIDTHPRFSTPLNSNSKIAETSSNNDNCNFNEFANFFNGIHRQKNSLEQRNSRNLSKIEKINDEKIASKEKTPILPIATRNELEIEKKHVLHEIERKCNFDTLFNRGRLSKNENHETFPICSVREKGNSSTRSLILNSANGRDTENQEKSSVGTKFIDEYSRKKDSSKSELTAVGKNIDLSKDQSTRSKNTEFTRNKTLSEKKNSSEHKSLECNENSEKFLENNSARKEKTKNHSAKEEETKNQSAKKEETKNHSAMKEETKNHSAKDEITKNHSANEEITKNKNLTNSSPGSSQRDRTSFDVSTVYSDDFEEPTASNEKTKSERKIDSPCKSISKEPIVPIEDEMEIKKMEEDKVSAKSSAATDGESKEEIVYLEKSISLSVKKSYEKKKEEKFDDDGTNVENLIIEEKGSGENNLQEREANLHEIEEKLQKESDSAGSSVKSTKVSRTSSLAEESRQDKLKTIDTCTENYSEGELYLPSSCSYSLGEIRISEFETCPNSGAASAGGVETSLRNADGMRIFFSKSFVNMDSSDNTINALDSPVQSLGEVQATDIESTGSSREISSDGQHQRGKHTIHS